MNVYPIKSAQGLLPTLETQSALAQHDYIYTLEGDYYYYYYVDSADFIFIS